MVAVLVIYAALGLLLNTAEGFVSPASLSKPFLHDANLKPDRSISLAVSPIDHVDHTAVTNAAMILAGIFQQTAKEDAKGQFFAYLLFSGGGLGVGFIQLPRLYKETQKIQALANEGPTEGGEKLSLGPAASLVFPAPCQKDVEKVIKSIPSAKKISKNAGDNYFASKGYIVESDFINNIKGCNPLAVFAAFDAIAGGKGGAVEPDVFDSKVSQWRASGGIDQFSEDLQKSATVRLGSYAFLVFLLLLISDLLLETGMNAFMG